MGIIDKFACHFKNIFEKIRQNIDLEIFCKKKFNFLILFSGIFFSENSVLITDFFSTMYSFYSSNTQKYVIVIYLRKGLFQNTNWVWEHNSKLVLLMGLFSVHSIFPLVTSVLQQPLCVFLNKLFPQQTAECTVLSKISTINHVIARIGFLLCHE